MTENCEPSHHGRNTTWWGSRSPRLPSQSRPRPRSSIDESPWLPSRAAAILLANTSSTPGSRARSAADALLMSIRELGARDRVQAVVLVSETGVIRPVTLRGSGSQGLRSRIPRLWQTPDARPPRLRRRSAASDHSSRPRRSNPLGFAAIPMRYARRAETR